MPIKNDLTRFMSRVSFTDSGCWLWQGSVDKDGYGRFWSNGRTRRAHRWSFVAHGGYLPADLVLDHFVCETPSCVAPEHLRAVTVRENILRGNTPAALNLAKTHCREGHPVTPENTGMRRTSRYRLTCKRAQQRARALVQKVA